MNENTFSFAMSAAYFRKFICKDINLKANHNILRKIIRFFCRFPYVKEIKKMSSSLRRAQLFILIFHRFDIIV